MTLVPAFYLGDRLLLYKDRSLRGNGDFCPLQSRLPLLNAANPELALDALHGDIVAHAGGPLGGDAAMLLLRYRT